MGIQLFTNNASSQLSGSLPQGGTSLVCAAGQGSRFPSPTGGNFFYLTLYTKDAYTLEQDIEVVKVTARSGDVLTVVRDIESITGQAGGFSYSSGSNPVFIDMRWTAGCVANMSQKGEISVVATSGSYNDLTDLPTAFAPSIITQNSTNRFVTDAEKATWTAKEGALAAGTTGQYYRGDKSWQTLDSSAFGLGNVTNTSDANKPVSTAQQTALNLKLDATHASTGGAAHAIVIAGGASGFMNGTDKTKLDGLSNYTHPANHAASVITQDASNRFVTDAEKTTWNGKEAALTAGTTAQYYRGDKSWQTHDKASVGLGNVDNTSNATERAATASLTNKTVALGSNTVSGTAAQFNIACTDYDFAFLGATNTFTGANIFSQRVDANRASRATTGWQDANFMAYTGTDSTVDFASIAYHVQDASNAPQWGFNYSDSSRFGLYDSSGAVRVFTFPVGGLGSGIPKFTSNDMSIATAGTDYVSPGLATTRGITMNTAKLLGRSTAATGAIEEITVGTGLTLSAGTLSSSGGATLGTPLATTSGTNIDFTSLPSSAKKITVMFDGVSTNGTSSFLVQIGDSGGVEATGYKCQGFYFSTGGGNANFTTGFGINTAAQVTTIYGQIELSLLDSSTNTWSCSGVFSEPVLGVSMYTSGAKSLSATLDRVRITTVSGTDTFDAGKINILYQ